MSETKTTKSEESSVEEVLDALNVFLTPIILDESVLPKLAYDLSRFYALQASHARDKFLPTPVIQLPTGREKGQFLAVDVDFTHLRVVVVNLPGEPGPYAAASSGDTARALATFAGHGIWQLADQRKRCDMVELFAWIGDCIAEVVTMKIALDGWQFPTAHGLELCITWRWNMKQDTMTTATFDPAGLASVSLVPADSGAATRSPVEVGSLLLAGYERRTRPEDAVPLTSPSAQVPRSDALPALRTAAITNPTVANLCALAYFEKCFPHRRVVAGIMVDEGFNAALTLKISSLGPPQKFAAVLAHSPGAQETVVEASLTCPNHMRSLERILTGWDRQLLAAYGQAGSRPLELMAGPRYLSELTRTIFVDFLTQAHPQRLAISALPNQLTTRWGFDPVMAMAGMPSIRDLMNYLSREMPLPLTAAMGWTWTWDSVMVLRHIVLVVYMRTAGLIAAVTVALLAMAGEVRISPLPSRTTPPPDTTIPGSGTTMAEELVVAYTGRQVVQPPRFQEQCQRFIDQLITFAGPQENGRTVLLREEVGGPTVGAAVLVGMGVERRRAAEAVSHSQSQPGSTA